MLLPSLYLPDDYAPKEIIGVVAGQRDYPKLLVEKARKEGVPIRMIGLEGETDEELFESFPPEDRRMIKVGQIGKMLKAMKELKIHYAVFVGQVTPGKLFRDMRPDLKAVTLLASLKERNAHTIFGGICAEIEKIGVRMLDARALMDDHLAHLGLMTGGSARTSKDSLDHGIRIAREIAKLDIGQGIVVRKGTVLAVEAFEGTDDMLSRSNKYKTDQLLFIKTAKHDQNPFFDWPVFGIKTLDAMSSSGIQAAALEAEAVIILEKDKILAEARKRRIELIGF